MIEVDELRKTFGDFVAVADISFSTEPGQIFGLLGPNGAGKSTTISCMSGLLKPDGGSIRILGHDVVTDSYEARRNLGVVPQELAIYEDLSAIDNLRYWGAAYGLRGTELAAKVDHVLEVIGLTSRAKSRPKEFSGGMKRRLNFGCGIVHEPKVLLLDEPTVGVDPQSRERLFDMVRSQTAGGTNVLYTTHHMEEAEELCDSIAIIDHGELIAQGTLAELRDQVGEQDIVTLSGSFVENEVRDIIGRLTTTTEPLNLLQVDDKKLVLEMPDGPSRIAPILDAMSSASIRINETTVRQPNLESLFLKITGTELRK